MKLWSRLVLFIIFSSQFLLLGCYWGTHGFPPPTLGVDRTFEELQECLGSSHKSYMYWRTRGEFDYYSEDWDAGGKWISPITLPLWILQQGLANALWETLWLPVDAPREMSYQSRCVESKAAADIRDRLSYERGYEAIHGEKPLRRDEVSFP